MEDTMGGNKGRLSNSLNVCILGKRYILAGLEPLG